MKLSEKKGSKPESDNKQANKYDKIFRENMEVALPGVIRNLLNIEIVSSEEIPDDILHTKERKPDLLKKVTDSTGKVSILHVEYQVKNEKQMVYRMAEYHIMLMRKYSLPIEQFVLYMGKGKSSMATQINASRLSFNYQLIAISQVDYKIFLQSDKPEEKMLALLANFGEDSEEVALQNILKGVQQSAKGDFAESSYFRQLRILTQLRNLDIKFMEAMETITKYFKEERDPYFRKGKAEGRAEGETKGKAEGKLEKAIAIARDMKKEGMPIAQIARFTELSEEQIEDL